MKKKQDNTPLTKTDFEDILYKALGEQSASIIEAVDFGFSRADKQFLIVKNKLRNIERRVIALEDIATEHGKELRKIRTIVTRHPKEIHTIKEELREIKADIKILKNQKQADQEKVIELEERVLKLEAKIIS